MRHLEPHALFPGNDCVAGEIVRELRRRGIAAAHAPDGATLLALLDGQQQVIVLDAAAGATVPGTLLLLLPGDLRLDARPIASRSMTVSQALEAARTLCGGTLDVKIVAMAIAEPGPLTAAFSPRALAAVPRAVEQIVALVATAARAPNDPGRNR